MALRRSDQRDPVTPPFGRTGVVLGSPNLDVTVTEETAENPSNYVALPYGTPHPDNAATGRDLFLVWQGPVKAANNQIKIKRIYVDRPTDENWYNYAVHFTSEGSDYPVFIRTYIKLREEFVAAAKDQPLTALMGVNLLTGGAGYTSDPVVAFSGGGGSGAAAIAIRDLKGLQVVALRLISEGSGYTSTPLLSITGGGGTGATGEALIQPPNCYLVKEDVAKLDQGANPLGPQQGSLFVMVTRVYETLPGPWIETRRLDPDGMWVSVQTRRQLRTLIDEMAPPETIVGGLWHRNSIGEGDDPVATETKEIRPVPGNPIPTKSIDPDGIEVDETKILSVAADVVPSETLVNGIWEEVTLAPLTELVGYQMTVSRAIPGRPLTSTHTNSDGSVTSIQKTLCQADKITTGEFVSAGVWYNTHREEIPYYRGFKIKSGDLVAWEVIESRPIPGATQLERKTTREFGGGILRIEKTIDQPGQRPDEGYLVTDSQVLKMPGDSLLEQKRTELLDQELNGTLELTDSGSGFTSDPEVAFTGGSAGIAATATASLSTTAPIADHTDPFVFAYQGDMNGVFFYLGQLAGGGVWRNPVTAGKVAVTTPFDAFAEGDGASILDRQPSNTYLVARDHATIYFDLGAEHHLQLKTLVFRNRADYGSPMGRIGIQGSNTGADPWGEFQNFDVGQGAGEWTTIEITDMPTSYRYFRLIIPVGDTFLSIGELELYGALFSLGSAEVTGVTSLNLDTPGSGYTVPPLVTFDPPGASAVAQISLGEVISLDLIDPGSYDTAPTVTIAPPTDPALPTASALVGYPLDSLVVDSPGANYKVAPTVLIQGDGQGAVASAVLGFPVADLTLVAGGSNYDVDPHVALTGDGSGATAIAHRTRAVASVAVVTSDATFKYVPQITGGEAGGATFLAILGYPLDAVGTILAGGSGYTSAPAGTVPGGVVAGAVTAFIGYRLASVAMTAQGTGYVSPPAVAVVASKGSGAVVTAHMSGYGIASIAVGAGGSAYTVAAVAIAPPPLGGVQATAHAVLSGGVVTSIVIDNAGSGYLVVPAVTITGDGTLATGSAVLTAEQVISLTLDNPGFGYEGSVTLAFSGGGGTSAAASVTMETTGSVSRINVTTLGSGYRTAPAVVFSGGGGTGAIASVALDKSTGGKLVAVNVVNGGDFAAVPTLAVESLTPVFPVATVTATLAATGAVTSLEVTDGGTGYTSPPSVAITPPAGGHTGSGAAAVAGLAIDAGGFITALTLLAVGEGYTEAPPIVIAPPIGGEAATAHAVLGSPGKVVALILLTPGGPFLTAPLVVISGGGGTLATGVYNLIIHAWPTLTDEYTDPREGIRVISTKTVVPAGTPLPLGFAENRALDKWRTLQIVSTIDLRTLVTESWLESRGISLPPTLLAVNPIWNTDQSSGQSQDATGQAGSSSLSLSVHGSIVVLKKNGFHGAALARVQRSFFQGIPSDATVPEPFLIMPASGTASITGHNASAASGGAIVKPVFNIGGFPAQIGDIIGYSFDGKPMIFAGSTSGVPQASHLSNGVGATTQIVDINDVITPGYSSSSGYLAGATGDAGDGALPIKVDVAGGFKVDIPPSSPTALIPGTAVLYEINVEKWRLGIWVRELVWIIIPGAPRGVIIGGGGGA